MSIYSLTLPIYSLLVSFLFCNLTYLFIAFVCLFLTWPTAGPLSILCILQVATVLNLTWQLKLPNRPLRLFSSVEIRNLLNTQVRECFLAKQDFTELQRVENVLASFLWAMACDNQNLFIIGTQNNKSHAYWYYGICLVGLMLPSSEQFLIINK